MSLKKGYGVSGAAKVRARWARINKKKKNSLTWLARNGTPRRKGKEKKERVKRAIAFRHDV